MAKICMFNIGDLFGKQTGGIKRFVELYRYLVSEGHTVDLYCGSTQDVLLANGCSGFTLDLNGSHKGFLGIPSHAIYLNNKAVYKKIKEEGYDAVISFDVPSTIGLCLAGVKKVNYFVRQDLITYRKIQYENAGMSSVKKNCLLFAGWVMEGICAKRSFRIISQCSFDLNQITKRHPFLAKRIKEKSKIQINNINPSWVKPDNRSKDLVEKKYDLIFVGNFDDTRKGYKLFLDAVELLKSRGGNYKCVMLGEGKHLEECKKKYGEYVHFLGFVSNPTQIILSSRLMVVPSYADSCPNTIMEALQLKVPVVGANSSGIPEILENDVWRFSLDAESLANKIQGIFDGDNLDELMNSQKERADELTFNWGERMAKIMNI